MNKKRAFTLAIIPGLTSFKTQNIFQIHHV